MPNNFGGLEKKYTKYNTAKVVVLPIPFDKSVSWLSGAKNGPKAIIEASHQVELYDIETRTEVYKQGIFTAPSIKAGTSTAMIAQAYAKTSQFLNDKKFVVSLGGDHSIAIGPIMAHNDYYKNISVLHLDAHADMRESYNNNKYSHASVMARVGEKVDNIVSVGIRSMDISEVSSFKRENLFLAQKICCTNVDWIAQVVKRLKNKVYISLDVDVFDSAIMPATGTPEPGGLNWYQVTNLISEVCKDKELIGMDVVELAPMSFNKAPDFLVAKLIYKILSYKFIF